MYTAYRIPNAHHQRKGYPFKFSVRSLWYYHLYTFKGALVCFPAIGTLLAHEAGVDQEDIVEASQAAPEEDEDLKFVVGLFLRSFFFWGALGPLSLSTMCLFGDLFEKFRKAGLFLGEEWNTFFFNMKTNDFTAHLLYTCSNSLAFFY